MKTRDKLLSVVRGAKDRTPTIALGVILLAGLFQGVRDIGKVPDVRRQLVGTWELTGIVTDGVERPVPKGADGAMRMTLREDGSAIGAPGSQKGTWYMGDVRHLHVVYRIGGRTEIVYEIRSISPDRFLGFPAGGIQSGPRMDFVWSRAAAAEESETSK
jgi:hypothetical protein